MNQKKLNDTLSGVVESCVNRVGVDLNTASAPLLSYISGITSAIAQKYCGISRRTRKIRDKKATPESSKIRTKSNLNNAPDSYAFKMAKNPLDTTSVHPESYEAAEKLLQKTRILPPKISAPVNWQAYPSPSKTTKNSQKNWKSEKSHCATS